MGCGSSTAAEADAPASKPSDPPAPAAPAPVADNHFVSEIGFVIKTRKADDAKVFINVFHHSSVLYLVTCDKPKFSSDRVGEPSLTYDVVVNTAVFKICSTNDDAKLYVGEQLIEFLNKKFKETLMLDFKIPRMKRGYVGEDIPSFPIPPATITERLLTTRPEEVISPAPENVVTEAAVAAASKASVPAPASPNPAAPSVDSSSTRANAPAPAPATAPVKELPMTFAGYAMKLSGNSFMGMQTRYFVLSQDGVISYYLSEDDHKSKAAPKGHIKLSEADKAAISDPGFTLTTADEPLKICVPVGGRTWVIHCETKYQADMWASAIGRHINVTHIP